jgi:stage III sporulation protein AD
MITLFLGVLLKEFGFRGARLFSILGTVTVIGSLIIAVGNASPLGVRLSDWVNKEYASMILKIICVGYVSGICSDICTDLGEMGLSGAVATIGKIEIVLISLPCAKEIIERGLELI